MIIDLDDNSFEDSDHDHFMLHKEIIINNKMVLLLVSVQVQAKIELRRISSSGGKFHMEGRRNWIWQNAMPGKVMVNWEGWKIESEHDMQYSEDGEKPESMTIYMQNVEGLLHLGNLYSLQNSKLPNLSI